MEDPGQRGSAGDLTDSQDITRLTLAGSDKRSRSPSLAWGGACGAGGATGAGGIPHTFEVHSYTRPTVCRLCRRLLRGLFKQGLQCRDCHYNVHRKCLPQVPRDCSGEIRDVQGEYQDSSTGSEVQLRRNLPPEDEEEPQRDTLPASRPSSSSSSPSANIPLQRIVQSVKHTKKREGQWLQQGWLVHCTNRDRTLRRHYWRLDSKAITLFQSEHGTKYYKEIPLNEILAVDTARPSPAVRARHQVLQGDPAQRDPRRGHRAALARR
ncbi:hypothetical protein ACJJTC_005270 [Scirpophaga incertulas]